MRRTSIAVGAILVAGLTAGSTAHAQYWLQDRQLTEGRGIRSGNFEFHPSIGAEVGYDSNVLSRPPDEPAQGAVRLRVTPSISVSTIGPQRSGSQSSTTGGAASSALPTANFRANLALVYHQFFGINQDFGYLTNLGVNAGFRLELFPQRTWQFNLADDFGRVIQGGSEGGLALWVYNRDVNRAAAELVYAPNGGILDLRFGYTNQVTFFEDSSVRYYSTMGHELSIRNRWRFLPKTAFLWEGIVGINQYLNPSGSPTGLFNSTPFRTRFGINGLLSERFGLLLMVGYHGTYFSAGDNADTIIAQAEARWITGPTSSLRFGLQRDVQNGFLGNYYIRNRVYLSYGQSFSGRFLFSTDLDFGLNEYGYIANGTGGSALGVLYTGGSVDPSTGRFTALRAQGTVFGEYRFNEIVGANLTAMASWNNSDVVFSTGPASMQNISWFKFEAYAGVRVNW